MLAQKCYTILNRPRNKGRDFFDVIFLLGKNVKPDYAYLAQKTGITNAHQLKEAILIKWGTIDANEMIADVEGFLFHARDRQKIALFGEIFKDAVL